jgi:hypothetical protein
MKTHSVLVEFPCCRTNHECDVTVEPTDRKDVDRFEVLVPENCPGCGLEVSEDDLMEIEADAMRQLPVSALGDGSGRGVILSEELHREIEERVLADDAEREPDPDTLDWPHNRDDLSPEDFGEL